MNSLPKLSLYIHIPWCEKKCFYCDFHSIIINKKLEKKYIKNIIKDLENDIPLISKRYINTIFIGGGTPTLLKTKSIKILIKEIKKRIKITKKAEITIESNPKTIEINKIIKLKKYGINRISLGIQTFNNKILKKLGRNYKKKELINSIKIIKSIKKININFDLMYGLPFQSKKNALLDIKKAISFKPKHISWYQLSIEPNTFFYKYPPKLPNDKKIIKTFKQGKNILKKKGYKQYEISSYSKKKYKCKHNLNYWNFGDYLGIGSGAHSKLTKKNGDIIRIQKNKNIINYLNGKYIIKKKKISNKKIPFEYFMNKFRIFNNIKYKNFFKKKNINIKKIEKKIKKAVKLGFIIHKKKYLKITKKGHLFLNTLLSIFL
ncbi:radical SAM family heme chaperone HemW [Buchnera aphidicola]|uniref:radical SAM family heme chaperone HemW n=1 Tax=Buchnera aphidicola TaxID=9 RepID=UPI0031B84A9C